MSLSSNICCSRRICVENICYMLTYPNDCALSKSKIVTENVESLRVGWYESQCDHGGHQSIFNL